VATCIPELDKNLTPSEHLPGGDNIPSPICPSRRNCDNITNKNGSQFCRTLGMYIVKVRLRGDSYDRYTYSSYFGSSTEDYFTPDLNPESLRAFTVSPLTPLSENSKITVYLNRAMLNHEALKPKELKKVESSVETYQKTIRQQ
jgi:hypothetical protein